MIESIKIQGLRGIREGDLKDLSPLVILVGPNGCGKSTVLDALLIGASPSPGEAIGQVVQRRVVKRGARWLLWRGSQQGACRITLNVSGIEHPFVRTLRLQQGSGSDRITCKVKTFGDAIMINIDFSFDNTHQFELRVQRGLELIDPHTLSPLVSQFDAVDDIRLVDQDGSPRSSTLHQLYSAAVEQGRGGIGKAILGEVVEGLTDLEILTEGDTPVMHLVFQDHSVPAALAGDGIQMLLRLSLELASCAGGVVLLEEPEVHQHPGAIRQSALAILAAVRRGIQVVLTTHSLEFIDALLAGANDQDLEQVSLYRLQLRAGQLLSHRLSGPDIAFARTQIEDDLR